MRDENIYKCHVGECNASYSWPPSTTVAGRHLRDKHPEIYAQVLNEEADRRNRKRAAEVGATNMQNGVFAPSSSALSDSSFSPPSSNPLGTPQPIDQLLHQSLGMENQFKRFKFDDDLFNRMGIMHFAPVEVPMTLPSAIDPFNLLALNRNAAMNFNCKQG
jgi:hypothetical protein